MDKVIAAAIFNDLVSRTPAAVLAAIELSDQPDDFDFITENSDVPLHCYQSVSKILLGEDNSSELPNRVSYVGGRAAAQGESGIDIMYASEEAAEFVREGVTPPDEEPACEYAYLKIVSRIQDLPADGSKDDLVRILDRRIKFLIDSKCRARRAEADEDTTPELDPTGIDNAINPNYGVICHWLKNITPSNSLEVASLYQVEFITVMTP